MESNVTDKNSENNEPVTDKNVGTRKKIIHPRFGEVYEFKPGDEVIAWREPGKTATGVIMSWELRNDEHRTWGGSVRTVNGEIFFPSDISCLRPLTKLDKVLK